MLREDMYEQVQKNELKIKMGYHVVLNRSEKSKAQSYD